MRSKGKITTWNDDKGYGFVTPFDGGKQVFIHVKAFRNRDRRPQVDDIVTFMLSTDRNGRPCAAEAVLAGSGAARKPPAPGQANAALIVFAVLFMAAVGISALAGRVHVLVPIAYAVLGLVTFAAYAWDKSAARRDSWRTKETTLHVLALAGGWPGALIAQELLRHKSRKAGFRLIFWATVLINLAALVWLHTDEGRAALESLSRDLLTGRSAVVNEADQKAHHLGERLGARDGEVQQLLAEHSRVRDR